MKNKFISNSGNLLVKNKGEGVYYLYDLDSKNKCLINESLKSVIDECDGRKSSNEILQVLSKGYKESSLNRNLEKCLQNLKDTGFINFEDNPKHQKIKQINFVTRPPLDTVYIEITKSCNLRCIHCYDDAILGNSSNSLTNSELTDIIDECDELGVIDFVITGGEPLMYDGVLDILNYIKKRRMDFSLFTNGVLLNEGIIKELNQLNPEYVAVSVDSLHEDVYRKIRGGGSLKRVLGNIELMIDEGINVRINSTIFKSINDSEEEINFLISSLKQMGIGLIAIGDVMNYGRANATYIPDLDINKKIKMAFGDSDEIKQSDSHNYELLDPNSRQNYCGVGVSFSMIISNGDITLCPVLSGDEFVVGNIKSDDLKFLWENSELFNSFRNNPYNEIKECSVCESSSLCLGGCKARVYTYFDKFQAPDLWSCSYFKD